jgi:hypothetical protein
MAIEMQHILVTLLFALGFGMLNIYIRYPDNWLDVSAKLAAFFMMLASLGWAVYLAMRWMW